ncbi:PilW family protein [Acinetobacter vivianii]|uniref:PilW family protein n=1 Tax=Acinetobacter vivianii TaxID=1776742 RepID=UPI002DBF521E|nr:PilW family protein [Acinetobacter vivianii]MEB6479923.1 PilW family protein [Acinetobacter vivianii]MEB6658315.1 PilW family protein [Acinetobacter vivianii]
MKRRSTKCNLENKFISTYAGGTLQAKAYFAQRHSGFTLIELIIALALGLLVSAVAIQLFLTSQRSITTQQAMMNLQNSTLFGLGTMINDIRLANYNSSQPYVNDKVLYGGVVLSANNISANPSTFTINSELLTRGSVGPSNLKDQQSDQLVIQYHVSTANQYDCEGRGLASGDYVVERYFLRADSNRSDPNQPLALACKAARYTAASAKTNTTLNLAGNGEIIIPRADHFSVRLGVAFDGANSTCEAVTETAANSIGNIVPDTRLDCFSYMNIENYRALTGEKPQIVSLQIGLLVRSTDTGGNNQFFDADQKYNVLNVDEKLKTDDKNKLYLRSVVTQTIAIRNGFGIQ